MSNSSWLPKSIRAKIESRDDMTCVYCGKECIKAHQGMELTQEEKLAIATIDHIVPQKELAAAAQDDKHFSELRRDPKNLVVACLSCNSKKRHMGIYQFCMKYGFNFVTVMQEITRRIAIAI